MTCDMPYLCGRFSCGTRSLFSSSTFVLMDFLP
jgi:hypothetical protein